MGFAPHAVASIMMVGYLSGNESEPSVWWGIMCAFAPSSEGAFALLLWESKLNISWWGCGGLCYRIDFMGVMRTWSFMDAHVLFCTF
jgi:hypothetical protein